MLRIGKHLLGDLAHQAERQVVEFVLVLFDKCHEHVDLFLVQGLVQKAILAGGFFLTSLALSWIAGYDRRPAQIVVPTSTSVPLAPSSPLSGSQSGGILDQLKQADQPAGVAPSGPSAPQSK